MQTENLNAIELFERKLTKTEIKSMASYAVDAVMEQGNPLEAGEALSAMEHFVKEMKADERFKDYVRDECAKYPKGYTSPSGAKVELAETGTKYNFENCNDPELIELEKELEMISGEVKFRQAFLKTVPIEGMDIITKDGEAVRVFPPSKTSTSSYKITLAK